MQRRTLTACYISIILALAQGCAHALSQLANDVKPLPADVKSLADAELPADFFIPTGFFGAPQSDSRSAGTPAPAMAVRAAQTNAVDATPTPRALFVSLYASPTTRAYFGGGLDTKVEIKLWETFLRKYNFAYQVVSSAAELENIKPGVLVLPSSVALSEREKLAVMAFRARGGSVLASWLTGVRDDAGKWLGFDFMETVFDVKVVGTTEADHEDNFMMPYGDSPVTHHLPAGFRVWLERAKAWHPLRLVGAHAAANIMDWSRNFVSGRPGSAIVFDERLDASGRLSRSVVLGYPERLWRSANPKLMEAITYNALAWLLRQPDAYLAAWPSPHFSAFVLAVEAADVISDRDLTLAKLFKDAGGPATYYVLSKNAAKSAKSLRQLQAMGFEVAYLGDSFDDFKKQSRIVQAKRFDTMRQETKAAGLVLPDDAGFNPPMESYDKTTQQLLKERAFGHFIASMDASEARLPVIAPVDLETVNPFVLLPRTQRGIEPVLLENYPELGIDIFLEELDLAEKMAGLSIITVPARNIVTDEEWRKIFAHLHGRKGRVWLATAAQVAEWWRERARVTSHFESSGPAPLLTATIRGNVPLKQAVAIWINLPSPKSALRLVSRDRSAKQPNIVRIDEWRAAILLDGLAAGEYRWNLYFDPIKADGTN